MISSSLTVKDITNHYKKKRKKLDDAIESVVQNFLAEIEPESLPLFIQDPVTGEWGPAFDLSVKEVA